MLPTTSVNACLRVQAHVDKARRDLELLETKRHAAELRMREVQAKEAAEAARRDAAAQAERDRQQARCVLRVNLSHARYDVPAEVYVRRLLSVALTVPPALKNRESHFHPSKLTVLRS